ncbi:hypothetical protein AX769_12480 [Frondihabitans sp. PAMC 28766]|uniref:HAD family hydrolase n=1 Tax=Frondihabitans sp. PAMC 28766 TaxID=1795630 RepID=UPI00078D6C49|nr:HAD family hydrolase [Frondihabitans sp. PAMC 28766]AMM20807.1 hypothetical protein AX769_12480 [Frondihabitans sp. PAMC 28766]
MLALLDLDETLVDRRGAFDEWAAALVAEHELGVGSSAALGDLDTRFPRRDVFFEKVAERWNLGMPGTALWDDYRRAMPALTRPFAGVPAALQRLRLEGWRLFVVSNGKTDNQTGKLHRAGLAPLLDGWFISERVGHRKPTPEFYERVFAEMGGRPAEPVWLVGDNPVDDIEGGRLQGFSTVWVSHGRPWTGELAPPSAVRESTVAALRHLAAQR